MEESGSSGEQRMSSSQEREINVYLKVMKTVSLKVKRSDTIKNVKEKFRATEGVHPSVQELFFAGNHMKETKTLADYDISENSTLNIFISPEAALPIRVKISSTGNIINLQMKGRDTVLVVKKKIWSLMGIPLHQQSLIFLGKTLEDWQTLVAYNIKVNSTLYMMSCSDDLVLYVKTSLGESIVIDVKSWYTIKNVKFFIESIEHISLDQQNLLHGGKKLDDDKTLSDCKVGNGSTLHLSARSPTMQILIRTFVGKTMTIEVEKDDTIDFVKERIRKKSGMLSMRYGLVFAGKTLVDARTLESYGVVKGSTLQMC